MRYEQADRAAVLPRQRLAFVLGDHPGLAVREVFDRDVGRVAAVAVGHRVRPERLSRFEEGVDRDTAEARIELRPLGDAVDVARDVLLLQRAKLGRRPLRRLSHHAVDADAPLLLGDSGRRAGGEDGEARLVVLARAVTGTRARVTRGDLRRIHAREIRSWSETVCAARPARIRRLTYADSDAVI